MKRLLIGLVLATGCGAPLDGDVADETTALTGINDPVNLLAPSGTTRTCDARAFTMNRATITRSVNWNGNIAAGAVDKRYAITVKKGEQVLISAGTVVAGRLYVLADQNPTATNFDWRVEVAALPPPAFKVETTARLCLEALESTTLDVAIYAPAGTTYHGGYQVE